MGIYSDVTIKIGDKSIEEFISISLSQEMLGHHHLVINVRQDQLSDSENFIAEVKHLIGKQIKLTVKSLCNDHHSFIGIICKVENLISHDGGGQTVRIHAFSPDVKMADIKNFNSFTNTKLSDIVDMVMRQYAINNKSVKPESNPSLTYTVQFDENGFEFLQRLAIRHGQWFFYDGETLRFGTLPKKNIKLEYGKDLHGFSYSQNLKSVDFKYVTHDYFLNRHETIDTVLAKERSPNASKEAYDESQNVYKHSANHYFQGSFPKNPGYWDLYNITCLAKAASISKMMFCTGKSDHAGLSLGSVIEITRSDNSFGKFIIVMLNHSLDVNGNYTNEFVSVPFDVNRPPYTDPDTIKHAEPHSAVVTDNNDPKQLGRVKVSFFWGKSTGLKTPWIRIVTPYAGSQKGMHFIPEVGEEVLVGFEGGNTERPYVLGSLYHGKDMPVRRWASQQNDFKAIRTRSGHTIEFIDAWGREEIKIYDNDPNQYNYAITLASHSKKIFIEAKGDMEIKADNLQITANKNFELKATNIKQEASSNMSLSANSNVDLSANSNVDVSAKAAMNIKSVSKMSLDGGAQMEQKASGKISVNGGSMLEQKAAIVKIN